jgi:hypothetical protein
MFWTNADFKPFFSVRPASGNLPCPRLAGPVFGEKVTWVDWRVFAIKWTRLSSNVPRL